MTSTTLTISAARNLAASPVSGATYYRVFDGSREIDRGHVPAMFRAWPIDITVDHLELGRTVELREGAADAPVAHRFTAIAPGVRAAI